MYLAMFIRTEPQLFHEMLRLRVGLIIQVSLASFISTCSILSKTEINPMIGNGQGIVAYIELRWRASVRASIEFVTIRNEEPSLPYSQWKGIRNQQWY